MTEPRLVSDLMITLEEYATVHQHATVAEALRALDEAQLGLDAGHSEHRAILVLDDAGKVVGKLSHWAILRSLEPKFLGPDKLAVLSRAGVSDSLIRSMTETYSAFAGSLEQLCRAAASVRAHEAMIPVEESIEGDAPLTEAIRQLVLSHAQSTLVTRGGAVIGILRQSDLFRVVTQMIKSGLPC